MGPKKWGSKTQLPKRIRFLPIAQKRILWYILWAIVKSNNIW